MNWTQTIVNKVTPDTPKPVVAVDTEQYLRLSEIQKQVAGLGYELLFAEDELEARVLFETKCRNHFKIILAVECAYEPLADIKADCIFVVLNPKQLFPNLDPKALSGLSYNALCTLNELHLYMPLEYDSTIRFLLENLYNVDYEALQRNKTKERVLATCIKVICHADDVSEPVKKYLCNLAKPYFGKDAEKLCNADTLKEYISTINATDIRCDEPVLHRELAELQIQTNKPADTSKRIEELLAYITDVTGSIDNQYKSWFALVPVLGELGASVYQSDKNFSYSYSDAIKNLNIRFQNYVSTCYESNFSLSGTRWPVTIDKVQTYLASNNDSRTALIVIDGMNVWQWYLLRSAISEKLPLKLSDDKATFSWLPSITAWARQSLFKGGRPDLNETNSKEAALFYEFWKQKRHLQNYQIQYTKIESQKDYLQLSLPSPDVQIVSFVDNTIDSLMHGAVMGNKQLCIDTKLWIEHSHIADYIQKLHKADFTVYITSDHGNIDAKVAFSLPRKDGTVSKSRSRRYVQFTTKEQAEQFTQEHPSCSFGIRDTSAYFTDENAFSSADNKSSTIITHGGSHIFELLVPLGVIK